MARLGRMLHVLAFLLAPEASAFVVGAHVARPAVTRTARTPAPTANLFESIGKIVEYNVKYASKAFESLFTSKSARASHILLKGPSATADALALKERIAAGEISFADAARDYSACPSSVKGGDLGTFKPGTMVPQFDEVIFNPSVAVGQLATAKTQFGTHVIQITERDMGDSA